jgi:signal transduction histidine kinase
MNQIALGYLELANDVLNVEGKLDKEHQSLIAKPMETLLNNSNLIRNVRKLQNEKAGAYEPQMIAIDKVLGDVVGQFSQVAGRDVKINLHACHCIVKANELIRDVFQNLIGNAIKHSAGPVEINVKAEKQEQDGKSYCRITVEDNGPGVPDIVKQKLFDRLSLERTRASGKGFGLCLTKMLVEDYKGKFWVEDRVHGDHTKGARFVVMLPVVNGP